MTWRAMWTPPGTPFPEHSDHETEAEAHAVALRVSREERVEVAVVEIGGDSDSGPSGAVSSDSEGSEVAAEGPRSNERIQELIERSSFGTPAAKAARASVSDEQVARVLRRVKELEGDE